MKLKEKAEEGWVTNFKNMVLRMKLKCTVKYYINEVTESTQSQLIQ